MRKTLLGSFVGSVVAVIAVACGGSDGSAPTPQDPDGGGASSSSGASTSSGSSGTTTSSSSGGPTGIYTPAQPGQGTAFCDASFGKVLGKVMQCCSAEDQTTQEYKLAGGVLALATQQCGAAFERSISEGHLEIDDGAAQACNAAYVKAAGATCAGGQYGIDPNVASDPEVVAGLQACRVMFRGKVAENGACAQDVDCVDGLTCIGFTPDSDGVCKQPPPIGEKCGAGQSDGGTLVVGLNLHLGNHPACATGAYCNKTCFEQQAPGESCAKDEECAGGKKCHAATCGDVGVSDVNGSCKSSNDCKTGLYCNGGGSSTLGTCQTKLPDGSPCSATLVNPECKGRCDKPDGGSTGTCKSLCGSG